MNSFMYSFVDDLLLVVMFLLACGWQISHLLLTVVLRSLLTRRRR